MYSKKSCIISLLVQCCKFLDYSLLTFELSETYPDVDQTEIIYINYLVTVTKFNGFTVRHIRKITVIEYRLSKNVPLIRKV